MLRACCYRPCAASELLSAYRGRTRVERCRRDAGLLCSRALNAHRSRQRRSPGRGFFGESDEEKAAAAAAAARDKRRIRASPRSTSGSDLEDSLRRLTGQIEVLDHRFSEFDQQHRRLRKRISTTGSAPCRRSNWARRGIRAGATPAAIAVQFRPGMRRRRHRLRGSTTYGRAHLAPPPACSAPCRRMRSIICRSPSHQRAPRRQPWRAPIRAASSMRR